MSKQPLCPIYRFTLKTYHGALEGHQRGQGHGLVDVDVRAEADTALDGRAVVRVLRAVRSHHLDVAVGLLLIFCVESIKGRER